MPPSTALMLVTLFATVVLGVHSQCAGEGACSSCASRFSQIAASSSRYTMSPGTQRHLQFSAQWASTLVRIGALSSRWTCTFLGLDCSADLSMRVTNLTGLAEPFLEVGSKTNCFDRSATVSGAGTYGLTITCHNGVYDCIFDLRVQTAQQTSYVVDLRATQLLSPVEDQVRVA